MQVRGEARLLGRKAFIKRQRPAMKVPFHPILKIGYLPTVAIPHLAQTNICQKSQSEQATEVMCDDDTH